MGGYRVFGFRACTYTTPERFCGINQIWDKHPHSRLLMSGNTLAFWHSCLRHYAQRTYHGQSLCNLSILVPQRQ
jgi:hypothetical protein